MKITLIIVFSVLLTISIMTSAFFFYLFKKSEKEKIMLQKKHNTSNNNSGAEVKGQKEKDFFDIFSFDCDRLIKRRQQAKKEGWTYRGDPYPYLDCPLGSIYTKNNKWINDRATHNIKHIEEITERENAVIIGICNMTVSGPKGIRFVIEDIYGKITTEPAKFKTEISVNELQGRLIVFKGYIENKKFIIKHLTITKFEATSVTSA